MVESATRVTRLSLLIGEPDERGSCRLAHVDVEVLGTALRGCVLIAPPEGAPVLIPPRTGARRNRDRERRAADHPAWRAVTAAALAGYRAAGGAGGGVSAEGING